MTDYYEDWRNETISWNTSRDPETNIVHNATRKSLHLDDRSMYEQEVRVREELIKKGAIKDPCFNCSYKNINPLLNTTVNAMNTVYENGMWKCLTCGESWDSLRIRFRGI